jgi:cobalt-precorrin-7 (C5)-methyltransferase
MIICIGAGPGSLDYLTRRGAELVRTAEVVAGFDAVVAGGARRSRRDHGVS